jgi:hypothetical protein
MLQALLQQNRSTRTSSCAARYSDKYLIFIDLFRDPLRAGRSLRIFATSLLHQSCGVTPSGEATSCASGAGGQAEIALPFQGLLHK